MQEIPLGGNEEKKKIPLIAWDKVCRRKKDDGLGLGNMEWVNKAFRIKIA